MAIKWGTSEKIAGDLKPHVNVQQKGFHRKETFLWCCGFPAEVRQALLDELHHCAEVLSGFLRIAVEEAQSEPARSETPAQTAWLSSSPGHCDCFVGNHILLRARQAYSFCQETLVQILRDLTWKKVRLESFNLVAEHLQLIQALFESMGTGSQLLLYTVGQILQGSLVIDGGNEDFHCRYNYEAAAGEVHVPSTSLLEYSTRSGQRELKQLAIASVELNNFVFGTKHARNGPTAANLVQRKVSQAVNLDNLSSSTYKHSVFFFFPVADDQLPVPHETCRLFQSFRSSRQDLEQRQQQCRFCFDLKHSPLSCLADLTASGA